MVIATLAEIVIMMVLLCLLVGALNSVRETATERIEGQPSSESVQSEKPEQTESSETPAESDTFENVLEQAPSQEYIEMVGTAEPIVDPAAQFFTHFGTSVAVGAVMVALVGGMLFLANKWIQKQEREGWGTEASETQTQDIEPENENTVEGALRTIASQINCQMSDDDKVKFDSVLETAKMFDSMFPAGGASHGRIGSCYLPSLMEIADKIHEAPSRPIATSLMPFFHRACDVIREAMEGELDAYQKAAVRDVTACTKAMEQMAAVHHDTDDVLPMQIQLES